MARVGSGRRRLMGWRGFAALMLAFLAATKTRLYLMDDSSDRLVPFVHTRALASDLQGAYERHSKFSIFSHVDLDRLANPIKSAPQLWGLYRHVNAVFQSVR